MGDEVQCETEILRPPLTDDERRCDALVRKLSGELWRHRRSGVPECQLRRLRDHLDRAVKLRIRLTPLERTVVVHKWGPHDA